MIDLYSFKIQTKIDLTDINVNKVTILFYY